MSAAPQGAKKDAALTAEVDADYFGSYSHFAIHREMISDQVIGRRGADGEPSRTSGNCGCHGAVINDERAAMNDER
eukprot:9184453-Pyramimonas_sp.AAC.2